MIGSKYDLHVFDEDVLENSQEEVSTHVPPKINLVRDLISKV